MRASFIIFILLCFGHHDIKAQDEICPDGDRFFILQNYFSALEAYMACYYMDSSYKKPLLSAANCLFLLGDYQKAKTYYHLLETDTLYNTDAKIKLASIYESQQNLPKAIRYNIALSKIFPGNPSYLRKLGSLFQQGNEPTQALQSYQAAMRLNDRDLLAVQGLSEMMLSLEQPFVADSLITQAMTVDSNHIGLSLLHGRVKYKLKDYVSCARILHKLTYQTELNNYYNKMLGYAFMQIDSLDKSIYHLQKSLLNEGDPEYAFFYLGFAHEKKKEYDKSKYFYSEAIKAGISENLNQYHVGLARINTTTGLYKEAVENYQASLKYHNDPTLYFYMASASEQYLKDKSKSIEYYQKFLSANTSDISMKETARNRVKLLKEQRFMKGIVK